MRLKLDNLGFLRMSDKKYLDLKFLVMTGKKLNLDNPKTFNEKLQWLKLYDRNPEYIKMVDKYKVKEYVAKKIGEEYLVPTFGVYDDFDEIDFGKLPKQFVMKATHDSGTVAICKNKKNFNRNNAKKVLQKSLRKNFYLQSREWPYKDVKPRIIVEGYLGNNLNDYKLFCFNGKPEIVLVCSDRQFDLKETWFNRDFELLELVEGGHRMDASLKKPLNFSKMLEFSKELAKDIPFVRVDFYEESGKLYFGELTFYPAGGYERFDPEVWNKKMGDMINLDKVTKK
ncbi:glycosyl transferase [Candidatus Saccharibacteria bacterium]|nr:glycosyl transferase [Candidatus Saccharibacteria bacterium]